MRFVSTALVMIAIALMLLVLMLLTPNVRARPNLRSQRCWCKPINAGRVNGIGAPNLPSGGLLGWWPTAALADCLSN